MSKTLCPGQDMRFWRPGDIFDVTCGKCGAEVEFFKDEGRRRCKNCGNMITNPRLSLGCAQWCEHAAECLGYDPRQVEAEPGEQALVDRLVSALKLELQAGDDDLEPAFAALAQARRLMAEHQGAEPRLVMAAALLGHADGLREPANQERAVRIMESAGLDRASIDDVLQLLHHRQGSDTSPEGALLQKLSPPE